MYQFAYILRRLPPAGSRQKWESMSDQTCVLVFGIDETASAVARMLLLSGYAVAIHQPTPPTMLRRKMAFADAWYDGASMLDGVQARRADVSSDFLIGLSNRMFIPVLTHPLDEVVDRWPWDVVVDAQTPDERRHARIKSHAELTIALGPGPIAGVDSDLVIETFGPDPGATLLSGAARSPSRNERDKMLEDAHPAVALETGIFTTGRIIGETVAASEPLGIIGSTPVVSPAAGRIRGLQRHGRAIVAGAVVADIATKATTQVSGSSKTNQLIARGVVFAIEREFAGWTPVSFDGFR
jgi:xanthine dehydrogenase accessory factor